MAGANREPSSLVQSTMTSGRSVSTLFSCRVRMTSRAPMTPEDAVEPPAPGLGVDVGAAHHRRQAVVLPRPAAEDVAHLVDGDGEVDLLQPLHEQVAGPLVLVGKRQALHAARRGGADLRHLLQARAQASAVDSQLRCIHGLVVSDVVRGVSPRIRASAETAPASRTFPLPTSPTNFIWSPPTRPPASRGSRRSAACPSSPSLPTGV